MTLPQLVAADFDQSVPQLLQGASVVALVPATDLKGWAAEMAWQVARAAASRGRRTALIDCFVNAPSLHTIAGATNDAGLVDAFEYGASFNKIVQQQPQASLFFIPAGTYSADAEPLMQHPRWRRLSAGFRHEEALLLLYVDAEHLAGLAAEPDGIVVLAPRGLDVSIADVPALTEAIGRGTQVLAVVADERGRGDGAEGREEGKGKVAARFELAEEPAPPSSPLPLPPSPAVNRPSRPRQRASAPMAMLVEANQEPNWAARAGIVAAVAAVGAGVWYGVTQTSILARFTASDSAAVAQAPGQTADSAAAPTQPAAPATVESLPYTVQIAALPSLASAFALADSLEARGHPTIVAPIRQPGRAALYRVHTGPYATSARADSALAALRGAAVLAANAGAAVMTPLSVALSGPHTREAALAERTRLREAGVPAFILGDSVGTFHLHAGAYDAAAQATLLQDLLTPTGGAGVLAPRTGYVP